MASPKPKTGSNVTDGKLEFADEAIRAKLLPHLQDLQSANPDIWTQVKQNASRTVYRGQLAGMDIYLKQFHGRSLTHRLGRMVGASRARYEMRFSQHLRSNGVAAPQALAWGTCGDIHWLATKAVEPSVQGDIWHEQQLTAGRNTSIAVRKATLQLADMIARMHSAGIIHQDLHCGNILVCQKEKSLELVVIDLHRVTRKRSLSRRLRAANLAQLLHDRYDVTTRSQRLRFLKRYLQTAKASGTLRGWEYLISKAALRHRMKQYASRDRRIWKNNRYFAELALPNRWNARVVLASKHCPPGSKAAQAVFTANQWKQVLNDPQALLNGADAEVIKDTRSGQVVRKIITVGDQALDVYIKRPRRKKAWKILLDCLRGSRPMRAFCAGHELLTRGISTALPLAAMDRRIGPLRLESILITEAVQAPHMNQFLNMRLATKLDPRLQELTSEQQQSLVQQCLANLGRTVQRLHDSNFAHRDLKSVNILIPWDKVHGPQIVLIDLDGLRKVKRISARRRFQGLMRLNVSLLESPTVTHTGRLRMLLGYLRRPGCGRLFFKPYWRMLEQWSARKLRQQIRSRRQQQRAAGRATA